MPHHKKPNVTARRPIRFQGPSGLPSTAPAQPGRRRSAGNIVARSGSFTGPGGGRGSFQYRGYEVEEVGGEWKGGVEVGGRGGVERAGEEGGMRWGARGLKEWGEGGGAEEGQGRGEIKQR